MNEKRNIGINVIGITDIIIGVAGALANLIYGFWSLASGLIAVRQDNMGQEYAGSDFFIMGGMGFILIGCGFLILFIAGILLLKLKPAGRKLALYFSPLLFITITASLAFVPFLHVDMGFCPSNFVLPTMLSSALIAFHIWYLNKTDIKNKFRKLI